MKFFFQAEMKDDNFSDSLPFCKQISQLFYLWYLVTEKTGGSFPCLQSLIIQLPKKCWTTWKC